jgi:hypothetical protein
MNDIDTAHARRKFIETLERLGVSEHMAETLWDYAFLAGQAVGAKKAREITRAVNESFADVAEKKVGAG